MEKEVWGASRGKVFCPRAVLKSTALRAGQLTCTSLIQELVMKWVGYAVPARLSGDISESPKLNSLPSVPTTTEMAGGID